jgi:hypothetical protein
MMHPVLIFSNKFNKQIDGKFTFKNNCKFRPVLPIAAAARFFQFWNLQNRTADRQPFQK